ncbi:type II toxin-antitoxin system PemK/MazF family toxin, partial [Clostridium perfringens]
EQFNAINNTGGNDILSEEAKSYTNDDKEKIDNINDNKEEIDNMDDAKIFEDKEECINNITYYNNYIINEVESNKLKLRRGDIVYAKEKGEIIRKFVVLQNDIANRYSPIVTVAPITAKNIKNTLPTHVEISNKDNRYEIILVEHITSISKNNIVEKVGRLNNNLIMKVNKAILVQLDLL